MSETIGAFPSRGGSTRETFCLVAMVRRRPAGIFTLFAVLHAFIWTIVPTLLCKSLPRDTIEGVAYGRDWQLGYWKHPPLPWLLLDLTHRLFGEQMWAYFLLSQLAVIVAFWAIWRLGREILGPVAALAAVMLLDGVISFNIKSSPFNHNIAQLPLFALAGLSFYRALAKGAWRDWLFTGLWFGAAFYAKYEAVVLLVPALLFSFVDPAARRSWKTAGPYLAATVCAVVLAPEAAWLVSAHFAPLTYADSKAGRVGSVFGLLGANGVFAAMALTYIVPVLALFVAMTGLAALKQPALPAAEAFARRYLAFLAFGPFLTALGAGLLAGRELDSAWAVQFWCFISLYLLAALRPTLDEPAARRLVFGWCGLTGLIVAAKIAGEVFLIADGKLMASQFPGLQFARQVESAWHAEESNAPLFYLVGDYWAAGNVMLHSAERPRLFESGDLTHTPLIDPADVRRRGAVILFNPTVGLNRHAAAPTPPPWLAEFPSAEPRPPFVIRRSSPRGDIEWVIGWALLKPRN